MRRAIRSGALGLLAAALLAGCSVPGPDEALHETVVDAPAGKADAVVAALTTRLETAGVERIAVEAKGDRVTARYVPGGAGVGEAVFTTPGVLAIRPLDATASANESCVDAAAAAHCLGKSEGETLVLGPSIMTNAEVEEVEAEIDQGDWVMLIDFTDAGARAMDEMTGKLACVEDQSRKRLAVLLDGEILSAPVLVLDCGDTLSDSVQFAGIGDRAEATRMAALLSAALPEGVTLVSRAP